MTRPKVEDDKRQRTAQACDSCKRRKQKCDGLQPCTTCGKRGLSCTYLTSHHGVTSHDNTPDSKRQRTGSSGEGSLRSNGNTPSYVNGGQYHKHNGAPLMGNGNQAYNLLHPRSDRHENARRSPYAASSDGEEEADNHTMTRMLVDPRGRLLYVGDTATLSFLQLIRTMVESTIGSSTFTSDPGRHRLTENALIPHQKTQMTHLLPDKQTTHILVNAFFVNANLIQVFDESAFYETLEKCYSSPLFVDPSWLCLLNLVLAIGLQLATPVVGSPESLLVDNLRRAYKCDNFFFNAKNLDDPTTGFEDADFWSVQALLLMTLFMLCRSKRNAAYAHLGMAVRSAYSLGLHREETLVIFPPAEQHIRRQVWRSLFIMDRFLSVSLGRPPAIHEEDCSGEILDPPSTSPHPSPSDVKFYYSGLEAGVRGCHILSVVIKEVYSKRKVSTKTAQAIADRCKVWPKTLPPALHWRQASPSNPRQAILILHVNIVYCHAIILFSRPFFLYLLSSELHRKHLGSNQNLQSRHGNTERFSEACIIAALHTIALIQSAYQGGYLPRQNPFIIYCLFSAALVVLSGKLSERSTHEASEQSITNALAILSYCGKLDPQAARMVEIFSALRKVIDEEEQRDQNPQQHISPHLQLPSATPLSFPQPPPTTSSFVQQMTHPDPSSQLHDTLPAIAPHPNPSIEPAMPIPAIPAPTFSLPVVNPIFTSPAPAPAASPHPTQQRPPHLPYIRTDSFSGLLDFDNADNPLGGSTDSSEESGIDNEVDFAAFWNWPGSELATPGAGLGGQGMNLRDLGVQGVSDSPVPLFGISMDREPVEA